MPRHGTRLTSSSSPTAGPPSPSRVAAARDRRRRAHRRQGPRDDPDDRRRRARRSTTASSRGEALERAGGRRVIRLLVAAGHRARRLAGRHARSSSIRSAAPRDRPAHPRGRPREPQHQGRHADDGRARHRRLGARLGWLLADIVGGQRSSRGRGIIIMFTIVGAGVGRAARRLAQGAQRARNLGLNKRAKIVGLLVVAIVFVVLGDQPAPTSTRRCRSPARLARLDLGTIGWCCARGAS